MFIVALLIGLPCITLGMETAHLFIIGRIAQRGVDAISATAARATVRNLQARRYTLANGVLDASTAVDVAKQVAAGSCSLPCMMGPHGCEDRIQISVSYNAGNNTATVTATNDAVCIATLIWRSPVRVNATVTLAPITLPTTGG